ncbi:MAG: lysozyme inhibitor LprI family protein [Paracoccus sp. (in: a-proteobacteria)]|nr:lysozyme inhibitor LprI family protein [Paracoccus sp. (in: a-proteobacteria)]
MMNWKAAGVLLRGLALPAALTAAPALAQTDGGPKADLGAVQSCMDAAAPGADHSACVWLAARACMALPGGETTVGMVECMGQEHDFWDKQLNDSYQALMARAKDQGGGDAGASLRQMQRDWIAYRDATCMWESAPWDGGTMVQLAYNSCMLDETARQALRLQGSQEPDICATATRYRTPVVEDCDQKGYDDWDRLLNDSYQAVTDEARGIKEDMTASGISAEMAPDRLLQAMQRDWIAYRDSTCNWQAGQPDAGRTPDQARADCLLRETARQALRVYQR